MSNSIQCPLCFLSNTKFICKSNSYKVWACSNCESDFVWPMPDNQTLSDFYDTKEYFSGELAGGYNDYDLDTENVIPLFQELLDSLFPSKKGSILDIGCAYGTHLSIAADKGFTCWGVEKSSHAREIANGRHGHKINLVSEISELPTLKYDLITMFDVLEHLPDPYSFFLNLLEKGCIGKKTKVIFTTPNARSIDAVLNPSNWQYRYAPAHLIYYSGKSLKNFLVKLNINKIEIKGIYPLSNEEIIPNNLYEPNCLNIPFSNFAGLLCIAQKS